MAQPFSSIILLADRPEFATGWAELHWREWGKAPGREELSWWVDDARKALNHTRVPVAFLALGQHDEVLGGVGLHEFDLEERRERSPWVVGMIVRADLRGQSIGQALMAALEAWAAGAGIEQLWVATETDGRAVAFYRRCNYEPVEEFLAKRGEVNTILTKRLATGND